MSEQAIVRQEVALFAEHYRTGFTAIEMSIWSYSEECLAEIERVLDSMTDTNCFWYEHDAIQVIRRAIELRRRRIELSEGAA